VVARGSHDTDRSLDAAQLALNRKWQPPVGYESRVWSCRGEMLLRARSTHPPVGTLRCARGRSISPRHCALAVDLYGTVLSGEVPAGDRTRLDGRKCARGAGGMFARHAAGPLGNLARRREDHLSERTGDLDLVHRRWEAGEPASMITSLRRPVLEEG
jgi:hypothetical protein